MIVYKTEYLPVFKAIFHSTVPNARVIDDDGISVDYIEGSGRDFILFKSSGVRTVGRYHIVELEYLQNLHEW